MEQFVKLSVYVEKVKNAEKGQRSIGSNKPTAGAGGKGKGQEVSRASTQRLNNLYQRMQNPRNHNFLDVIEYNHLKN